MRVTLKYLKLHPELYEFVFVPHKTFGEIRRCRMAAWNVEYPLFLWDDLVYSTEECKLMTVDTIKEWLIIS
jgi:hypothetical protein